MKNVLLLVHDDLGQEARLQAALDICRAIRGHLHCLDVTPIPSAMATPTGGLGAGILFEDARVREAGNKARLQERLDHEDVPWSWTDAVGDFGRSLKLSAGLADLVVINRVTPEFPDPDMRAVAEELVLSARRPVVAVPFDAPFFDAAAHALVAWDGSAPATAAMIAAVPLLRQADATTLLQIGGGSAENPIEEAAAYLSRHGIEARIASQFDRAVPVGEALLAAISARKPGYVVMGAYGHRPATEAVFGGTTRTMLERSPVPLFLAH